MKKLIVPLLASILLLCSCGGIKTSTSGMNNESFLEFVTQNGTYESSVTVIVDGRNKFQAKVFKDKRTRMKGEIYAISPGVHDVIIEYNNQTVFSKKIFISTQETKTITLP